MELPNTSKVLKVGNSLAITIPAKLRKELKIFPGDLMVFGVYDENTFALRRITQEELQNLKPKDLQF